MNDKMAYLMLVVHTEPPLDITEKGLPKITGVAHSHEMPVTCVVTKDVALHFGSRLKNMCDEVGAHLHPYIHYGVTFKRFENGTTNIDSYAIDRLPEAEQYRLMKDLTETIQNHVDVQPKTFIAGRWAESQDGTTLRILEKLGYTVDVNLPFCKPIPLGKGHSDWTGAKYYQPYFPDRHNVLKLGESPVLMIPQTVLPPKIRTLRTLRFTEDKVLFPMFQTEKQMQKTFEWYYKLRETYSPVSIVIYMHSFEGERKDVMQKLGWFLSYASHKDVVFVTPQEYLKVFNMKYNGRNPSKTYSVSACTAWSAKRFRSLWAKGRKVKKTLKGR